MAKILLNVELNTGNAQKQIKSLQSTFELMAKSLNSVSVNKNLTAQMNSAARYYNAIAKAAKSATDATEKRRLVESKIATQEAKTSTELAKKANLLDQIKVRNERLANSQKKSTEVEKENTEAVKKNNAAVKEKSQSLVSMIPNILKWQVAMTAVMKPLRLLQNAIQSINSTLVKTEDAVIALQRVLPAGSGSDSDIANRLYDLAAKYGQTFDNAAEIATSFARAGLDWNKTIQATEAALLALNVAELDATQASDGLLSIITQFGLETSDLTEIVDKLNKTADNFPVTTEKLLTALQRTGSAAKNANLELDDTIGIITALSKATNRSGANLGTAANALIQYSTKSSALDIFSKVSQESAAAVDKYKTGQGNILDVWREVASAIGGSESRQQDLLSQLKDNLGNEDLSQDVQDELSDIFEQMQEVYGTANTFRKNYFIALLDNIETVDSAITTAGNSAGYSQKENQKYLDTYTAKVNTLKTLWEQVANDEQGILGIKKSLVDIATWLLKGVQQLGGIKTVLAVVVALTATWLLMFKTGAVINFFTSIKNGIMQIVTALPQAIAAWRDFANGVIWANEAMQASIPVIGLVLAAVSAVVITISSVQANAQEAEAAIKTLDEQISDLKQNIAGTASELSKLEEKLEENNKLIDKANQIGGNDTYITRLQTENKELERQIDLNKILHKKEVEELGEKTYKLFTEGYYEDAPDGKSGVYYLPYLDQAKEKIEFAEKTGVVLDSLYSIMGNVSSNIGNLNLDDPKQKELYDTLQGWIDRFNKLMNLQGEVEADTEKWVDSLEDAWNSYKKIAEALKEIRDEKEDTYNYEQKILDVQKAQQQLEDAQKNKNVRVLNAATGIWEWQANEKDVQSAEENLQRAQHNLEKAAFDQIIAQFEYQTATTKGIAEILAKVAPFLGADSTAVSDIKSVISSVGKVRAGFADSTPELTPERRAMYDRKVADIVNNRDKLTYDSGGILSGLGGIKATSRPETVLPPDLTEKILTPSSNEDFARFAKSLGIIFGTSREVAKSEIIHNNSGNTTNTDNRSYMVNGVPFTQQDADSKTLTELFADAAYFNN